MLPLALSRLRALLALLLVLALVSTGTAVAQDDAAGGGAAEEEPAPADEGDGENDPESTPKKGKRKGKKTQEPEECEVEDPDGDNQSDSQPGADNEAEPEESDCVPPPRCEDGHVDLAPEEDEPNCIDQARLNRLIANFEAAAAEEAAALEELSGALDQLGELNQQLDALRDRLGDVQIRLAAARADAGFAEIRQAIVAEGLDDVSAALDSEEDHLKAQAVEAYMGGDEVELATAAAILEIENYADLETAREYATVVIGDQLATVDRVDALRSAVEGLAAVIDAIEHAAAADLERVRQIEEQVDVLISAQSGLVVDAEAEAAAVAEKIAQIQQRKQVYAEELRVQGVGGGAIGEALRTRQADQEQPETSAGLLSMPLANTRLGSPFGPRIHPIFNDARLHSGIDMSGRSGEAITASADGVVVHAEETGGYGNVVVIDHGNTVATLYAHMSADAVFVGQEVGEGELLGFVGSTGYSTGPHLHYEVRISGTPVDPMLYLRLE